MRDCSRLADYRAVSITPSDKWFAPTASYRRFHTDRRARPEAQHYSAQFGWRAGNWRSPHHARRDLLVIARATPPRLYFVCQFAALAPATFPRRRAAYSESTPELEVRTIARCWDFVRGQF